MNFFLKLQIIFWYLRHPLYYKQFFFIINKKLTNLFYISNKPEKFSLNLYNNIKNEKNIINNIFQENNVSFVNLRYKYSDIYTYSLDAYKACPIKMGGESNIDLLFNIVIQLKPKNILETGVAFGWSSLAFLLGIKFNNYGKLISIDMPYPTLNNEKYVGCVVPESLKSKWELIRLPDITGLPLALKKCNKIDLCHYDSDKSYQGRMRSYPILWNALNKNGIFISDDISDNDAFEDFLMQINKKPFIVKYKNQYLGIVIK